MGVNLKDIIPHKEIEFEQLKGKTIAIDALNSLYQFLASIRQPDGTPLMDSKGNVTSHLSGLLYRTSRLMDIGIKPIYVFDGEPPELKRAELDYRKSLKEEALEEWKKAKKEGRLEDARKFAQRTSRFTDEMLEDSKKLLDYMGVPYVQAPGEGEAQCAYMCIKGDAWAVGSQDYDALLFGAPLLVKGLTLSGKLELSLVSLEDTLKELKISREGLIDIAILVGTDFNAGIKGIGPKKALKAVYEKTLNEFQIDFDSVRKIFLKPEKTDDYRIEWKKVDTELLVKFLCSEHNFNEERVRKTSDELLSALKEFSQQDLSKWF